MIFTFTTCHPVSLMLDNLPSSPASYRRLFVLVSFCQHKVSCLPPPPPFDSLPPAPYDVYSVPASSSFYNACKITFS